jgi:3-deoxy-D-manno-octulosonic acid (KDO) 8-phosphate synthase
MKKLKLTTAATTLTLVLSFSAFAGQMDGTLASQAPTTSTATVAGDMYGGFVEVPPQPATATSSTSSTATAVNPLTQLILVLLNLLPKI